MNEQLINHEDLREEAYLYDLYVSPQWRETFNELLDAEIKLPDRGNVLDAGCGTGDFALSLALRLGPDASVIGVDPSEERLSIARAKAALKNVDHLSFRTGTLTALGLPGDEFDLVVSDASMLPVSELQAAFAELTRAARARATVALALTTRGSFDEFFSIYWEGLYELGLLEYSPGLEAMITERHTVSDVEQVARLAGLKNVRSVTSKQRFDFLDAAAFFSSPIIERYFLPGWFELLPDDGTRQRMRRTLAAIIDRERHHLDFDVSIKATIAIGQK
jgi:ubiquinone/menaquinone biosynthesis C-methylase UbiE